MPWRHALLLLLAAALAAAVLHPAAADDHDCVVPEPQGTCVSPLVADPMCRGQNTTDPEAWMSMDCDYVIYDIPAEEPTNKWIVVHAGDCDNWTAEMGDYFSKAAGTNLFGLRQSRCDALHISWTMPDQPPTIGLGFNPPGIIEVAKNKSNQLLFLHEYDGLPTYPWAGPCNETVPTYICITSDDPDFDRKFYGEGGSPEAPAPDGVKALLEAALSNRDPVPCKAEVIDARNSTEVPGFVPGPTWPHAYASNRQADLPCSGMFPDTTVGNWQWEHQGIVTASIQVAILKNNTELLDAYVKAIDAALGSP
ncbi:hypothetical protein ABPG75_004267 [Micractinium tetrahymenae]